MSETKNSAAGPATKPASHRVVDFYGVATLIDAVAGAEPQHLATLLDVLWSSHRRLEARIVVELALRCRDPLAPLASLCRDALRAAADFDALLEARGWRSVGEVRAEARAAAILNLCDEALSGDSPLKKKRRGRCRAIRPRLNAAAVEERQAAGEAIERVASRRETRCPDYWPLFRSYLALDRRIGLTGRATSDRSS